MEFLHPLKMLQIHGTNLLRDEKTLVKFADGFTYSIYLRDGRNQISDEEERQEF